MACDSDIELIFSDRLKNGAFVVGVSVFRIVGDAGGINCDVHFVNFLPRHLDVRPAGADHPELRVIVTPLVFVAEMLSNGQFER